LLCIYNNYFDFIDDDCELWIAKLKKKQSCNCWRSYFCLNANLVNHLASPRHNRVRALRFEVAIIDIRYILIPCKFTIECTQRTLIDANTHLNERLKCNSIAHFHSVSFALISFRVLCFRFDLLMFNCNPSSSYIFLLVYAPISYYLREFNSMCCFCVLFKLKIYKEARNGFHEMNQRNLQEQQQWERRLKYKNNVQ
jgi:hypothetical protein